jgi:hypothetical protein
MVLSFKTAGVFVDTNFSGFSLPEIPLPVNVAE